MSPPSQAVRGVAIAAMAIALACGRPSTPATATARFVTLRDGDASFGIDPETLAVESGGALLSAPIFPKPTVVSDLEAAPDRIMFRLPEHGLAVDARLSEPRLTVRITSTREQAIDWPRPSSRDVRALALPIDEGLSISPTDKRWHDRLSHDCRTAHGGLSMPFIGLDRNGPSFAIILASDIETAVCGELVDGVLTQVAGHAFRYDEPYEVVFAPADGTPIGSALAYRAWLKSRGGFVSFSDKVQRLPPAERLAGAMHAYLWGDGGTREAVDDLARLGVERALLAFDDDQRLVTSDVVRYAESRGYLMARYDTFDCVMDPAKADSPVAVFDDDLFRTGGILGGKGGRMPGFAGRGLQLSSEALRRAKTPFIEQRIADAKTLGASAYFLDSDAFGELYEDFDVAHPMTLERDRQNRMERMRAVVDAGFVLGSESAVAWSTPVVFFSHGNETIATETFWKLLRDKTRMGGWSPPKRPALFFEPIALSDEEKRELFDPTVRVPLFQAVFHDSIVTTDRWEMGIMKAPDVATTQTLFALLYGVPTMWNLDRTALRRHRALISGLARFFTPLHRRIATLPLDAFEYLSTDRLVQRARFGDAVEVTANFARVERAGLGPGCVEMRARDNEHATFCP
jgi:hypothetical protein